MLSLVSVALSWCLFTTTDRWLRLAESHREDSHPQMVWTGVCRLSITKRGRCLSFNRNKISKVMFSADDLGDTQAHWQTSWYWLVLGVNLWQAKACVLSCPADAQPSVGRVLARLWGTAQWRWQRWHVLSWGVSCCAHLQERWTELQIVPCPSSRICRQLQGSLRALSLSGPRIYRYLTVAEGTDPSQQLAVARRECFSLLGCCLCCCEDPYLNS